MPVSIPTRPADITREWTAAALADTGQAHDIESVDVYPIGTGQMATSLRVSINYAGTNPVGPASVVVKIASSDENSRLAGARGAYLREVRFYQQLVADLPVITPRSFWAQIDPETHQFAIMLQDMHPARQGDQIEGCTPDQALVAARNIAGLHAPRWCDETLFDLDWLTVPRADQPLARMEAAAMFSTLVSGFIDRYRARIEDRHVRLLRWFETNLEAWLGLQTHSFGLVHGDHRLDNLLFATTGSAPAVTVVDWQTLTVRTPPADVSYLLGTGLEPDVRGAVERDIVAGYHDQLIELGVNDYTFEQCFDDYRTQTVHALLITVLGSMLTGQTRRGDDMFMAMLHRSSQQIFDLDAVDAISETGSR